MKLLNYIISADYPEFPTDKKIIVNTINPHSYCIAKKDKQFKIALKKSDILLPDGIGIVFAAKILKGKKIKKIAGYDLFLNLMEKLNRSGGNCFFLGASTNTLRLIKVRAAEDFPNVRIETFSPPYKAHFSIEENQLMCDKVNAAQPDVLFVGMTAPKQEKWVYNHKDKIDTKIICSIGAVFDFYAGTVKRPSKFWIDAGLEWLPRFLKEPGRLARRNLISTPLFLFAVLKEKVFFKIGRPNQIL